MIVLQNKERSPELFPVLLKIVFSCTTLFYSKMFNASALRELYVASVESLGKLMLGDLQ